MNTTLLPVLLGMADFSGITTLIWSLWPVYVAILGITILGALLKMFGGDLFK